MKPTKIIPLSIIGSLFIMGFLYLLILCFPDQTTLEEEIHNEPPVAVLYVPTIQELKLIHNLLYTYRTIAVDQKYLIDPTLYRQVKKAQKSIKQQQQIQKSSLVEIFHLLTEHQQPKEKTLISTYFRLLLSPTIQRSKRRLAYSPLSSKKPIILQTKTVNDPTVKISEASGAKVELQDASIPIVYYERDQWMPLEKAFKAIKIELTPAKIEKIADYIDQRDYSYRRTSIKDVQRLLYHLHLPMHYATYFLYPHIIRLNPHTNILEIKVEVSVEEKTSITGKNVLFRIRNPHNQLVAPIQFDHYNRQTKTLSRYQLVSFLASTPQSTTVFHHQKNHYYYWQNGRKNPLSFAAFSYYLAKARILHYQNKHTKQLMKAPTPFSYLRFWKTYIQPIMLILIPMLIGYVLSQQFSPFISPLSNNPFWSNRQYQAFIVSNNDKCVNARGIERARTNNCYVNSTLQLLANMTEGFLGRTMESEIKTRIRQVDKKKQISSEKASFLEQKRGDLCNALKNCTNNKCNQLREFLQRVWIGPSSKVERRELVDDEIKKDIWNEDREDQQDASEFLIKLCEKYPIFSMDNNILGKRVGTFDRELFELEHKAKKLIKVPLFENTSRQIIQMVPVPEDKSELIDIKNIPPDKEILNNYQYNIVRLFNLFELDAKTVLNKIPAEYKAVNVKEEIIKKLKTDIEFCRKSSLKYSNFGLTELKNELKNLPNELTLAGKIASYFDQNSYQLMAEIKKNKTQLDKYWTNKIMEKEVSIAISNFGNDKKALGTLFTELGFSLKNKAPNSYETMQAYLTEKVKGPMIIISCISTYDYYPVGKYYLIHLKRFGNKNSFPDNFDSKKHKNDLKEIPEKMKKKDDEGGEHQYELIAIIYHSGSMNSGHYTIAKKTINNQWAYINDSSVKKTSFSEIQKKKKDPYILCYKRVEE